MRVLCYCVIREKIARKVSIEMFSLSNIPVNERYVLPWPVSCLQFDQQWFPLLEPQQYPR